VEFFRNARRENGAIVLLQRAIRKFSAKHFILAWLGAKYFFNRREGLMAEHYLLKTEPSEYSFADLQRDKETVWDGVSNPAAVKNLREIKPGAKLIICETGERRSAVGMATVVKVKVPDPKKPEVAVKAGKPIGKPVSLDEIKAEKLFADSPLVKIGRLSVVPLTAAQYKRLAGE
jgi:predicted RNA-binding protein with PUA-like domain